VCVCVDEATMERFDWRERVETIESLDLSKICLLRATVDNKTVHRPSERINA
jgi:hypothetical protein